MTSIGTRAFVDCSSITELEIPDSVTELAPSYVIPLYGGVVEGGYLFSGCTNLQKVKLPNNLTSIGRKTFYNCKSLKEIELPDALTSIGYAAFWGCEALPTIDLPDSVTDFEWTYTESKWNSYDQYEQVFSGEGIFGNCRNMTEISLPDGITEIGHSAFAGCERMASIAIPESVTKIGPDAFMECVSLKNINYAGSMEQWDKIAVEDGNHVLLSAEIHPYCNCDHPSTVAIPGVPAACEVTGLTEGAKCSVCGEITKEQEKVPALGHDYEETILNKPTCAEYGLAEYVCKNDASHTYLGKIEPTGKHDYSYADGLCSVCGEKDPNFTPNPFTDVADSDYFFNPVMWAVSNKITGGVGEGLFGPDNGCTRGQVVMFLWAANGKPEPKSLDNPFDDVSESDYYYKAVLWAVENGITGGIGEGLFGPHATCTRAQIVTFLYSALGKPEVSGSSTFTDVLDTDWYVKPVLWAAEKQVTGGIGEGMFGPNNTCTRGQVVTFLYKVYG